MLFTAPRDSNSLVHTRARRENHRHCLIDLEDRSKECDTSKYIKFKKLGAGGVFLNALSKREVTSCVRHRKFVFPPIEKLHKKNRVALSHAFDESWITIVMSLGSYFCSWTLRHVGLPSYRLSSRLYIYYRIARIGTLSRSPLWKTRCCLVWSPWQARDKHVRIELDRPRRNCQPIATTTLPVEIVHL